MKHRQHVAVVGIGCRLPGGIANPREFAEFLRRHGDAVVDVPADRWNADLHYDSEPKTPGKTNVRRGAFLSHDIFSFDPDPFGISPKEADQLDPQQRLLLEVTWEAFEDAGIPIDQLRGSNTAVYVGGFTLDHQTLAYLPSNRRLISAHTSTGASMTLLSNRLSYTFDLRGPSLTIDTACSSSLVASHLGYEAVSRGESDLAIVGGVNVMLSPATFVAMSKGQFLASDGRSKTFSAEADGYGRGEGAAVAILKPLAKAVRDGDRVYAVIVATGVNQDGRTPGIALPNSEAQRALCERVLRASGLRSRDIGYVEMHGTGTQAGDLAETRALGAAYGQNRKAPLVVGSVKSNIGHLEAAAGVTGLVKAAISIQHREVFPIRSLEAPNPEIAFADLNLRVAVEGQPWPARGAAHAAVNAFGYGGTNAHVILSEAPGAAAHLHLDSAATEGPMLVPLSAANRRTLVAHAAQLAVAVDDADWANQVFTLARRRSHWPERASVVAGSASELREELRKVAAEDFGGTRVAGRAPSERRLLWVFTGMGPQWWGMGQDLYRSEPAFRGAVEEADRAFQSFAGWSVLAEMLCDEPASRMRSNWVAQPANFVLQVGLVALLRRFGVPEDAMVGHSVGEVAAAWAAGCLSLEEAALVAFHRSRLQQTVAGKGTMLAVALSDLEVHRFLDGVDDVSVAAYNAPRSLTLAGARAGLERVAGRLSAESIFNRFVPVEIAYHSPHMDPLEHELRDALQRLVPKPPRGTLYSTARGRRVAGAVHDAGYWWENARQPVLLQTALQEAAADGFTTCLEIGPHPVLATGIREVVTQRGRESKTSFCMKRGQPERETFYRSLGELFTSGVSLRWEQIHPSGRFSELPTYPFSRERHWTESDESREMRVGRPSTGFSRREHGPMLRVVSDLARPSLSYLLQHQVQGAAVFPGAGYIDSALSACLEVDESRTEVHLVEVAFERAFILRTDAAPELQVEIQPADRELCIYGRHDGQPWERHARARVLDAGSYDPLEAFDIDGLERAVDQSLAIDALYRDFDRLGLAYGPEFRPLQSVHVRRTAGEPTSFLARLRSSSQRSQACVDPPLLDGAFQAVLAAAGSMDEPMLPVSAEHIRWFKRDGMPVWAHGHVHSADDSTLRADLMLLDLEGAVVLEVRGLVCRAIAGSRLEDTDESARLFHFDAWRMRPWPAPSTKDARPWGLAGDAPWLDSLERELNHQGIRVMRLNAADRGARVSCARWVFAVHTDENDPMGLGACDQLRALLVGDSRNCPLRVVTFGAHRVVESDCPDPVQTALSGFARVAMTEMPELSCRVVDLGPATEGAWPQLLAALADERLDEEAAVRANELYVHRITRAAPSEMAVAPRLVAARHYAGGYSLERGAQDGTVRFTPRPRFAPGPGQVEVALLAISIDPYDVPRRAHAGKGGPSLQTRLRSMVGTVTRIGSAVRRVDVGDRVHLLQRAELTSHVLADERLLVSLATDRDPVQAVAYADHFVAWHALVNVARIEPGERVLIHDAGSPIGAACLEVAALFDAQIYATVGSDRDRDRLRARGIERVYSHATLDFVDAIMRSTMAKGVHVVLNGLPDPVRGANLELLGNGGRLVEMRPDLVAPGERSDMRRLPRGGSFSVLDLGSFANESHEHYLRLTRSVLSAFARGQLGRPSPETSTPTDIHDLWAARAEESDRAHRVLDLRAGDASIDTASGRLLLRPDRTYLVTGGLAGFGLATAEWLVHEGARNVVLGSRRGRPDADVEPTLERMRRLGARVECLALDVASGESLDGALDFIGRELPMLAGVFHSAMVLDDGPIASMTTDALRRVMLPKAYGALLLDQRTRDLPLDHFVLYSSVSALIGNPNQAAYAAANAFLDGVAARRRFDGLPATCVNWGAIDEIGVVSRDAATRSHLQRLGITPIPVRRALTALGQALRSTHFSVGIIDMQWDRWKANFVATPWNRLAEIGDERDGRTIGGPLVELRDRMATWDVARKRHHLAEIVRVTAAQALGRKPEGLDDDVPLTTYGLDSLIAVELQVALEQRMGVTVPTIQFVAGLSVAELCDRALDAVEQAGPEPAVMASLERASDDLRAHFLSRICVQPPYFALLDCRQDDGWVEALVRPVPPGDAEDDVVSCAEAARHLAIVGSCAVSLQSPHGGRVYYPVRRASYVDVRGESGALSAGVDLLETARVRARCVEFDAKMSRATAETCLLDEDGQLLFKLMVDYHVVPEEEFERLFSSRREPTGEDSGLDPYLSWNSPETREDGDDIVTDLGEVQPAWCLGHFVSYPALPVSIMTRHALHLVGEGVRREAGPAAQIAVRSGWVETSSFVFAGESPTMTASCIRRVPGRSENVWRCEVHCSGRVAAVFEFNVAVRQRRVSEVRPVGRVGLTA